MKNIMKIYLPLILLFLLSTVIYPAFAQTPDPGIPGPHTVIKAEYNLGNTSYTFPSGADFPYPSEEIGSVHYPADLGNGPYPVIEILHGRHGTCYDSVSMTEASEGWPCTGTNKSIVSYEGYDYLARNMASHGYIVISISANDINANDGPSNQFGMPARAYLMQHHLDLWHTWNTAGGFPGDSLLFVGALDMQNIGTMGHSRGGEGVVFHALLNRSLGSPYGIKAVFTLAPVDFYSQVLNGIPLLDVAPYCDGDVNDLEGLHFYDNARYNDTADEAPKHDVLYMGADHDFFNTVWTPGSPIPGGYDDWLYTGLTITPWCGPAAFNTGRFDSTKQMAGLVPYFAAFYRMYLGHEMQFAPILDVDDTIPPASSTLNSSQVHVSFHPSRINRLDINRADSTNRLTTNSLGGNVTQNALLSSDICGGGTPESDCISPFDQAMQPHNSNTTTPGLSQLGLIWDSSSAWCQNDLPGAYRNISGYQDIIFRTTVNYSQSPLDSNLNFTVQLIDSAGDTSGLPVASYSNALFYQPGNYSGDLPKSVFNTVKIPLADFSGVDLTNLIAVRFRFDKSIGGAVFVSDLAFNSAPCSGIKVEFADTSNVYSVAFTNTTIGDNQDSIRSVWNFGDIASGTSDTSTLKNPTHVYPGYGSYTACLYVTAYRKNGFTCTDSVCSSIGVFALGVPQVLGSNITIVPNPASDHLYITGTVQTDVLTILDLYGQVVFSTVISDPTIKLPSGLATGIYSAVITTGKGKVYNKLLISQ